MNFPEGLGFQYLQRGLYVAYYVLIVFMSHCIYVHSVFYLIV